MRYKEIDFIERIVERLNDYDLFAPVEIGLLESEESLSVTPMPGGVEQTFYSGTKTKTQLFQVSASSQNQKTAFDTLSRISQILDNIEPVESVNGSYEFLGISEVTSPSLISVVNNKQFLYQMRFSVDMIIKPMKQGDDI